MTTSRRIEYKSCSAARLPDVELAIHEDMAAIEDVWRAFEKTSISSAYQRFDFQNAWHETQGLHVRVQPRIVTGHSRGELLFILPFGEYRSGPVKTWEFLCGQHANYNLALFSEPFMRATDESAMLHILKNVIAVSSPFDALIMKAMPLSWEGIDNPLVLEGATRAPAEVYQGSLVADYDELFKQRRGASAGRKARRRLRKLTEIGEVKFVQTSNPTEMGRILRTFLAQKASRFARLQMPNAFDEPMASEFLHTLVADSVSDDVPILELYALSINSEIYAILGGAAHRGRFTVYFNSIKEDELAKYSPGDLLTNHVVEQCCKRGLSTFDLGAGAAAYKEAWCKDTEPLFDVFVPLTLTGRAATASQKLAQVAKRRLKEFPRLSASAKRMLTRLPH